MSIARVSLNSVLAFAVGTLLAAPAFGQKFVPVNFPGATQTGVNGMDRNNAQVLVGDYLDESGNTHGYIFTGGSFSTLDFPGNNITVPQDVNDLGQVVGQYFDSDGVSHGFQWSKGTFTTVDFPGSISTFAGGINNAGEIVGGYADSSDTRHGFLFSGGKFSTVDIPGASGTSLSGINNQDHIAGNFADDSGQHGFLLTNNGMTTINAPNSSDIFVQDLNNADELVGGFIQNDQTTVQAFTYSAGVFTTVVFPGASSTDLTSLSDSGVLTGVHDSTGLGFVRTNGPFSYVANISSNTVSMSDTSTLLPVTNIPVGAGPWGVAISPNGSQVYVTNNHGNSVSVIDTASSAVVATIPVQLAPFGVAFTPDGASAYVVNGSSNTVSVIDTDSQTVVATVPVQSSPVGVAMALTSNGPFAYVTNSGSNTVSVIAVGAAPTVVKTINVGSGPRWVAVAPNSSLAYVENAGSNSVSVISVANNNVAATIPVGTAPLGAAFTPDGSTAYVVNTATNTLSVINTASNTVITTVAGLNNPAHVALTPDGSAAYVTNLNANTVSVISTTSNTITGTVAVGAAPIGVAIASAPPTSQTITQPLSPTQPNQFNFGPHNLTVQYPPGTNFSGVNMSVTAAQTTQAGFQQRVAGTQFASAACIVYSGAGGNCVDYQVACSDMNGGAMPCPSVPAPNIDVKTSYDTLQTIINPGFLSAPTGTNQWQSVFSAFYLQRIDPTTRGRTKGFSEFFAIDKGATNAQGAGTFTFLAPLRSTDPRVFGSGVGIPVAFQLVSVTPPAKAITDAVAGITVVMVSDANGNPQSKVVLSKQNAFQFRSATNSYFLQLNTTGFAPGTYVLTVYGDAFAAQQVQFSIKNRVATTCAINSSSPKFTDGQPITFTARVRPVSPATGTPAGSVTFVDSGFSNFVLGTAPLVAGDASIKVVLHAPPDRQFIKAMYSGNNIFNSCQSGYIAEDHSPSNTQ
jgi:YVTN family beta-propeller protein/probable HAF family extracellular repeat protein